MLQNRILLFTITVVCMCLLFWGCAPVEKSDDICPAEYNVLEAMAVLSGRWAKAEPFYANGQCLWTGRDTEGKERKENFPIKIWAEPPGKFCLHGDILFDGRGMVAGANGEEFWLVLRPKELRGYMWGRQGKINKCIAQLSLPMNPRDVLEALGMIHFEDDSTNKSWRLTAEDGYDILINSDDGQNILKKVYVNRCDYLVRKIEYFSTAGDLAVVTELDKYRKVTDGFEIPSLIKIHRLTKNGEDDKIKITLKSMRPKELTEKQRNFLFSKPPTKRFESVLVLSDDCEWIEQDL